MINFLYEEGPSNPKAPGFLCGGRAFGVRRSAFGVRRSAFGVRRSAFGVRRSAFGVRRSAFGVRRSAFGVRRSAFGVRRSAFGVRRSAFGVRRSAFGVRKREFGFIVPVPPCPTRHRRGEASHHPGTSSAPATWMYPDVYEPECLRCFARIAWHGARAKHRGVPGRQRRVSAIVHGGEGGASMRVASPLRG